MASKQPAPLVEMQARKSIQIVLTVQANLVNAPRPLPALRVPPGCSVTLAGYLGATTNGGVIYTAYSPEALKTGSSIIIPPSNSPKDAVPFAVDNLNEIWWMSPTGTDGLTITVLGTEIG